MFTQEHAHLLQILQIAIVPLGTILGIILAYILKGLRDLRSDLKGIDKKFDDFVRADTCRVHREALEQHMRDYEARINDTLSHCKKRSGDLHADIES